MSTTVGVRVLEKTTIMSLAGVPDASFSVVSVSVPVKVEVPCIT
jgi:hypothetical protein